jgi:hypothetical protein
MEWNKGHDKITYPQLKTDKGLEEIISSDRRKPDKEEETL